MQTNANWNMLGHEWAVDLLRGHLANGRARHAYLFTGPHGVGRRTLALRLAQTLNCTHPPAPGILFPLPPPADRGPRHRRHRTGGVVGSPKSGGWAGVRGFRGFRGHLCLP